ncbi:MAG: hypothetical protein ABIK61_07465 [candidate division WOR-3 bacterium]
MREQVDSVSKTLAARMREAGLTIVRTEHGTFTLDRRVITSIPQSQRRKALKYDMKHNIGIFHTVVNGMRVKAWFTTLLGQGMQLPPFIAYTEEFFVKIGEAE